MVFCKQVLLCLIFPLSLCVDLSSKNIEWISVENDQVILMRPDPVGREQFWDFFLCRAEQDGSYFAGKLKINRGKISCSIPFNGKEVKKNEFQMLNSPPGTLSWVPISTNSISPGAVVGGKTANGKNSYVCRAVLNDTLISGTYTESTSQNNSESCNVPLDGKLYAVNNKGDIEVLVVNMYGQKLGAQQSV